MKRRNLDQIQRLRERAEQAIAKGQLMETELPEHLDIEDALHLLEELRIYQAELEIQNDELHRAQNETAQSLEKYRRLFTHLPLPAILVDSAGLIVEFNAQASAWLDLRASRQRRSVLSLFGRDDGRALCSLLRDHDDPTPRTLERLSPRARHSAEPLVCDVLVLHLRGETVISDYSLLLLIDRRAEQALAASEERYREQSRRLAEVIWGTDIGTWEWNVQTGATLFNERWAGILGYRLEELEPIDIQTWVRLAHPDDLLRSNDLLARCFTGELEAYECEARMRHRDGHWVWVLDRGRVVEWTADGEPLRMSGTHQDITERRLQEERLRAAMEAAETANQAKSAFLANMSHEIRTPLNAVLGFCHLLRQRPLDAESQSLAVRIQDSGRLLLSLIDDILDFSRIEAGRLELEPRPFRLESLLADLASLHANSAAHRGLILRIGPPPPVAALIGDARRLKQVLINLIGNAIKFTEQGTVELILTLEEERPETVRLRLEVRDTGIGIHPEQQHEIFNAFSQADRSINRRFGGSGLGLAISQQLVRLMGGTLQVESRVGIGSTFWCVLEFARAPWVDQVPTADSGRAVSTPLSGTRVLVVDDSDINRELAERLLTAAGATVALADDGRAALAWLAAHPESADIVLMDVQMPHLDGYAATRLIRQDPRWRELPIVALTAGAFQSMREAAQSAGMNDFIAKPFDVDQLMACIQSWTGARIPPMPWAKAGTTPSAHPSFKAKPEIVPDAPNWNRPMSNTRLLIVDDEPANLAILRQILEPHYSLLFARNGSDAIELAQRHHPNLVLLDIQMPGMDGYSVCRRLKDDPHTEGIPVIFVTTLSELDNEERGFAVGCVDYLSKLVKAPIVLARVRAHLSLVQAKQLDKSYRDALAMLAKAGHYNDSDTGMHIWRMAAYARRLAEAAGWSPERCELLELAAPMHDTGKIDIPDAILRKPGKLDDEEWVIMRTHSRIGHEILAASEAPIFQLAAEIALRHHEHWDGGGYPDGLAGEAIPESARIVAIADVFDALTMKRPYKEAWPIERTLETLQTASGRQFEPRLLEGFMGILPQILEVKASWDERDPAN